MLFRARVILRTAALAGAFFRAVAERRAFAVHGVIQLPDHGRGGVGQRLHREVFPRAAADGLAGKLLSNDLCVVFGIALAIALRIVRERDPKTLHVNPLVNGVRRQRIGCDLKRLHAKIDVVYVVVVVAVADKF